MTVEGVAERSGIAKTTIYRRWRSKEDLALAALLEVIREVRPQVMITYDPNGFYGHPDHIQSHRVAMRAVELAGELAPAKVYWTAVPRSVIEAGMKEFAESSNNPFADAELDDLRRRLALRTVDCGRGGRQQG